MHKFKLFTRLYFSFFIRTQEGAVYLRMPEIIAIDFGTKRTGIAATDPLLTHFDRYAQLLLSFRASALVSRENVKLGNELE